MNRVLNKTIKILTSIFIIIVVLLTLLLGGARLFGLEAYTVLSGSMEPSYPTGSLIYVKSVDPATLDTGDVITFQLSSTTTATHRIIELVPDENDPDTIYFRTKGDANNVADGTLLPFDRVIGTPIATIPLLGFVAVFIQSRIGTFIAIAACMAVVIINLAAEIITSDKSRQTPSSQNDA